jgi:DNA-binding transcriptional regulator YiaG
MKMTKDKDLPVRHPLAYIQDIKDKIEEARTLRVFLEEHDISPKEFAFRMGVSRGIVDNWRYGKTRIPPKFWIEIVGIIAGEREMPPIPPKNYFR